MIVAIDGPAGAGKSSMARLLADRLGFAFLDTGAMYRCVTLGCLNLGLDLYDTWSVAKAASDMRITLDGDRVYLNGDEVTERLREPDVTRSIRPIADNQRVRELLVGWQREWAGSQNVVTEGRDQATVAFPNAECKIFLTASPEERAKRRIAQLEAKGLSADYAEVLQQQNQRDDEDTRRAIGGLRIADDAIVLSSDGMSEEQVIERLLEIVRSRTPAGVSIP